MASFGLISCGPQAHCLLLIKAVNRSSDVREFQYVLQYAVSRFDLQTTKDINRSFSFQN